MMIMEIINNVISLSLTNLDRDIYNLQLNIETTKELVKWGLDPEQLQDIRNSGLS